MLIAFPLRQWLHERASVLRHTYTACLVHSWGCQWRKRELTVASSFSTVNTLYCWQRFTQLDKATRAHCLLTETTNVTRTRRKYFALRNISCPIKMLFKVWLRYIPLNSPTLFLKKRLVTFVGHIYVKYHVPISSGPVKTPWNQESKLFSRGCHFLFYFIFMFCWPCVLSQAMTHSSFSYNCLFQFSYMFRATMCLSSGESIVSIRPLVYVTVCRWPCGVVHTTPHGHLYRVTYTRGRIDTNDSPDDEHLVARNM